MKKIHKIITLIILMVASLLANAVTPTVTLGDPTQNGGQYSAAALASNFSAVAYPIPVVVTNLTSNILSFPDIGLSLGRSDVVPAKSAITIIQNADQMQAFGNYTDWLAGAWGAAALINVTQYVGINPVALPPIDEMLTTKAPSVVTASTYTVTAQDSSLIFNTSATHTLTLPSAVAWPGRILVLKNIAAYAINSATSNVAPVTSVTAGTAIIAATAGKVVKLQSDGTIWQVMLAN